MLHEVLHAALLHVLRRGVREKEAWNIAADIVVNGIICQQAGFELPEGVVRDRNLEHLSVEEIYELLPQQERVYSLGICDLFGAASGNGAKSESEGKGEGDKGDRPCVAIFNRSRAELESHWQNAMQQAAVIARTTNQGTLPARMDRELGAKDAIAA